MKRVVVLGTTTGAGKTYFSVSLTRALRKRFPAEVVLGVKPVESGVDGADGVDAEALRAASSFDSEGRWWRLKEPLSPHLAARRQNVHLDVSTIAQHSLEVTAKADWVVVETAGGAFSPLSEESWCVDLAGLLEPAAWILVAPDSLGVLHDLTACLIALEARARRPDIVVLSQARPPDASTGTNAEELARLGIAAPFVVGRGGAVGLELVDAVVAAATARCFT